MYIIGKIEKLFTQKLESQNSELEKMKGFFKNKWFKFTLITVLYLLWVHWVGNYWLLLGEIVIVDMYLTKKVHWAFWKKKGVEKQTNVIEWVDAIIFAVIAATFIRMFFIEAYTIPTSSMEKSLMVGDYLFVSKVAYGPKIPNTPISFPFAHNTLPLTKETKSYSEAVQWPYKRLSGLGEVKRGDAIVFNFPEGDTVLTHYMGHSYYQFVRQRGRKMVWNDKNQYGNVITRPVDKRENYIKRCIALPGDSLKIVDGEVYVNNEKSEFLSEMQYNYYVKTKGSPLNAKVLDKIGIPKADQIYTHGMHILPLTNKQAEEIKKYPVVVSVTRKLEPMHNGDPRVFPQSLRFDWNEDNFGALKIPHRGLMIDLTPNNLALYRRAIEVYEGNKFEIKGDQVYINGQATSSYTFTMDYYWAMGDNRHNSADSRYWGFVPEDHLVGKAVFVWLSLDKDKGLFGGKIRWNRLFRPVSSLID